MKIDLTKLQVGTKLRRTAPNKDGDKSYIREAITVVKSEKNTFLFTCEIWVDAYSFSTGIEVWNDGNWEIVSEPKNRVANHIDLQKIIDIACPTWKVRLAKKWGEEIVLKQTAKISDGFYQEMRKACTKEQNLVFDEIFGSDEPVIDYDRLKTGSKVMLKDTGKLCNTGLSTTLNGDESKPYDVVFFKTKHLIGVGGKFKQSGPHSLYSTFHQDGIFVLFGADEEIDYITKVVEY